MLTFFTILTFILIGTAGGFLLTRRYKTSSLLANIIAGITGSLSFSRLAALVGIGRGFTIFSIGGIVAGAVGACLLPFLICLIQKKATQS